MRAIMVHETGGPEVLKLVEVPEPAAGPGHVVIRTEAIGVSHTEASLRAGGYPMPVPLPAVYGVEAAGVVVETGEGADPALAGRRVVVLSTAMGCYAEYVAVPADVIAEIPPGISSADAVAVANFGAVALCALRMANLTGEETVLVEAAAGGVGGYLTQLARRLGAKRVIGTAGGQAKGDYARSIGADEVVDHTDPQWPAGLEPGSIDVVFESIGADTPAKLLPSLRPATGRILAYGFLTGAPTITALDLMSNGGTLTGCGGPLWFERVQAARADVFALVADGHLTPRIDTVLPLDEAAEAHRRFDTRAAIGKIVLLP
ncbi:MAG TPA: zinc-binding dehydrogenase [Streptosporangiaceae bacterium]|nr:zinc-binding dehydrogenase [Streptosporangiaceae bacterium]